MELIMQSLERFTRMWRGITKSWRKDCEIYLRYIHVLPKCVLPCRSSLELMWYDSLGIRKWWCSFIAWLCFVFLQDKQYFMFSLHLPCHKYFLNTVTYFITCTLIWHINVNSCLKQPHESLAIVLNFCVVEHSFLMWVAKELIDIPWLAEKQY